MIIGFDGSRAFSDKRTGTENYSFQLLKALAKIDKKNQYIVYIRPNPSVIARPRSGEAIYSKQDRHVANTPRDDDYNWPDNFKFEILNFKFLWTQGGLALQTFIDKLDVLFVPSHTLPLIRKPGLKTVVTVHDLGSEYLPNMHQLKQRLYLSLMQKFQLQTATKIIAVSKATKEDLVKRIGLDSEKIEVVYEGYDKSLYRKLSIDTLVDRLISYHLRPQEYFLFVGTVQPRKNLERVIKAFHQLINSSVIPAKAGIQRTEKLHGSRTKSGMTNTRNDKKGIYDGGINLVIAGSKGWLSDEIYELPKKLGIEDRVKFLGYVPDKDLPALYSGAIAFLYPSLFEGFGLPILEAQTCGCPVITSNISSMPEVAGDGGAILVDPYNVEEIARGMGEIREIGGIRGQIIKAGFENVRRFSWEKCAEETLRILEDLD